MPNPPPLMVVRLTPLGRGAVATLHVEGPGAVEAVAARFLAHDGRPLAEYPVDQIVMGRFGGSSGEEVVVRRTSDDAVELHCHGGRAVATMIEDSLADAGCQPMTWQEWATARTPHAPCEEYAALAALAEAPTERTAAILLDQYHGALRRELDEIQNDIGRGDSLSAQRRIGLLLSWAKLGEHLTRPWSVVLAGRPNVGKSSLINALAGYARTIVHDQPGTTRDAVALTTAIDGWPVELCDTAGLRATRDPVEQIGVERARERLSRADLVVLVADGSEPWSAEDQTLFDEWPRAVLTHNKSDRPSASGVRPPGVSTSATLGNGIDVLLAEISRQLVPDVPPRGAGVPCTAEQVAAIEKMRDAMIDSRKR